MKRKRRKKHPQPKYQAAKLMRLTPGLSDTKAAIVFGVHRATVLRWRNLQTMLDQWDADRYAVRLGKHPSEIWADWFDIEVAD